MRPILQPLQPTHAASMPAPGASTSSVRARSIMVTALVLVAAAFATLASAPSNAHAATLADKQAQAAELDRQVSKLERRYDDLQERWRGAAYELEQIRADVEAAHGDVVATQRSLGVAKRRLATRATVIYRTGGGSGDLAELASAGSVTAFFDRIDTIRRVGDQDANVLVDVEALNAKVEQQERALKRAKARSAAAVAKAAAAKDAMAKVTADRQSKLDSVNADIQAIMAEQRRIAEAKAAEAARESAALAKLAEPTSGGGGGGSSASGSGGSTEDSGSSGGGGGASVPLPPGSGSAASAASAAMSKLGSPYVWAAAGPDSFDCSGLVMWAFAQAGRGGMPHSTYAYAAMGVDVPLDQLQVGDLVFGNGDGHMGIYVGGGSFVHAPHSGDVVKVTSMSDYGVTHARRV